MAEKLSEVYPLKWFRNRTKSRKGPHVSSQHLADLVHQRFHPQRAIDLGAGSLGFANRLGELGVVSYGVDGSPFNAEFLKGAQCYIPHDLRKPLSNDYIGKFDLVTSWDVFEHIPESSEPAIVQTILNLASDLVLLSIDSSTWGVGHVNCKPKGYWRRLFEKAGLQYQPELTKSLKEEILNDEKITSKWYGRHLLAFKVAQRFPRPYRFPRHQKMNIACLHWLTTSVGGINTRLRTYREVADYQGDRFDVFVSANQRTKFRGLLPERKTIRGGDSFITIDGYAPHHENNVQETYIWLAENYDAVMLSFLCPHPTKAYGDDPVFLPLLQGLKKKGVPIIGYISDAYWDTYKQFGEATLKLCDKCYVTQTAYADPLVKAGYRVRPAYIPFIPIEKHFSTHDRKDRRVVWIAQWKNIKGIHQFYQGIPRLVERGFSVRMYNSGIEYYKLRLLPEWKKIVGHDSFAPQYSGNGEAGYLGWKPVEQRARVLSIAGFMCDFQGHRAKFKAYQSGSYNNTTVEALYYGCVPVVHESVLKSQIPKELLLPVADLKDYPDVIAKYDISQYNRKQAREYVMDRHDAFRLYGDLFDEYRRS